MIGQMQPLIAKWLFQVLYPLCFGIINRMNMLTDDLPNDIDELKKMLVKQQSQLDSLRAKCQFLEEQFRLAQHRQFGKSHEGHPSQGDLFNEAEQLMDEAVEPEQETLQYTRNKPKRKPLPKELPR